MIYFTDGETRVLETIEELKEMVLSGNTFIIVNKTDFLGEKEEMIININHIQFIRK